ncbi:MAG TPA: ATP-binding cassette domain-containing protein [Gammaproteobacteria bacterium]|nr:ATP-binding cassette domain-containing protein [Gammaproteobacteria bacterium]
MPFLTRFDKVSLAFGDEAVLVEADFAIGSGERVCLIGRNGAGISTTLKLIGGELLPDNGRIESVKPLHISVLDKKLAEASEESVREFVARGMADQLARIAAFRRLAAAPNPTRAMLAEMESFERQIEAAGGWSVDMQIDSFVSQLALPADMKMSALSGGSRRRASLAQALVSAPDLLLLDEPTNHLDISTIERLEAHIERAL